MLAFASCSDAVTAAAGACRAPLQALLANELHLMTFVAQAGHQGVAYLEASFLPACVARVIWFLLPCHLISCTVCQLIPLTQPSLLCHAQASQACLCLSKPPCCRSRQAQFCRGVTLIGRVVAWRSQGHCRLPRTSPHRRISHKGFAYGIMSCCQRVMLSFVMLFSSSKHHMHARHCRS